MPAYDLIHDLVKTALIKDGWTITDDPLTLIFGELTGYVDLAAEKPIAASKGSRKIAVEIKSFSGPSKMQALEAAIGQFQLYTAMLAKTEPDRIMYLAITDRTYVNVFSSITGRELSKTLGLRIIVIAMDRKEIESWNE